MMALTMIMERLRGILQREFGCSAAPRQDAHLHSELMLDSLDLVDLLFLVRSEFGVAPASAAFVRAERLSGLAQLISASAGNERLSLLSAP